MQENQGAQQGAPVRENIKVEDVFDRDEESDDDEYDDVRENIKVEDVLDDDEESDDDESDDDSEDEPDTRKEQHDQRSVYFDTPNENDYGRGKRDKKTSFSFLQTSFEDLTQDDRAVFFHHAWNEYKKST